MPRRPVGRWRADRPARPPPARAGGRICPWTGPTSEPSRSVACALRCWLGAGRVREGHERRRCGTRRCLLRRRAAAHLPKPLLTRHRAADQTLDLHLDHTSRAGRIVELRATQRVVVERWRPRAAGGCGRPRCGSSWGGVQVHYGGRKANAPVGGSPLSDSRRATDDVGRGPVWVSARSQLGGCRGSERWSRSRWRRHRSCSAPARPTPRRPSSDCASPSRCRRRTRWHRRRRSRSSSATRARR